MNAKYVIFVAFAVVYSNGRAVDQASDHCVDSYELCKRIPKEHCQHISFLKTVCSLTCGECEDPCSINNGGCNQFCSGVTEAQCSCRDGYQLAADRKTCIDINECETNPCKEEGKECVNSVGSYSCQFLKCERFGIDFSNHHKSDSCCIVEPKELPTEENLSKEEAEFEKLLNESPNSQWPSTVQILSKAPKPSDQFAELCGGALIAPNWIATSALCMDDIEMRNLKVVIGHVRNAALPNSPKEKREERSVTKIIVHPDSSNHDIALIQLSQSIQYNEFIQPIHLPCGKSIDTWKTCYVTGFGRMDNTRTSAASQFLKEISVTILPPYYCSASYESNSFKFNSQSMLCATNNEQGKYPSFGDGGNPMLCQRSDSCQWFLYGMVSQGRGDGSDNYPGIYTNIVDVEAWIKAELRTDLAGQC